MKTRSIPLIFITVRLLLFLSLPLDGLTGYGDLPHFFGWARLDGWPFLDYWMEFPPLFPFLAEALYRMVGGREHAFYYLLALGFTLVQAANLALFMRIAKILRPHDHERRAWAYFALLAGLFYGWTYFDPLAVCALLAGILFTLQDRRLPAALAFGLGALVKWFPILGLPALLRKPDSHHWRPALLAAAVLLTGWGILLLTSPDLTLASIRSQSAKGSWETVWALIDGNLTTGNFGAKSERYDSASARKPQGNPAVVSPLISLIPFALVGLWTAWRVQLDAPRSQVAFTGFTLALFFLWSPGWSPQWILYIIPLLLLVVRHSRAGLLSISFVLVNLLEWPLLLSRGLFNLLWVPIILRTMLLLILAIEFWTIFTRNHTQRQDGTSSEIHQG